MNYRCIKCRKRINEFARRKEIEEVNGKKGKKTIIKFVCPYCNGELEKDGK